MHNGQLRHKYKYPNTSLTCCPRWDHFRQADWSQWNRTEIDVNGHSLRKMLICEKQLLFIDGKLFSVLVPDYLIQDFKQLDSTG
jgi:hypothetical protein